ncbi:MAG: DnaD domain protein [Pleurocapsa minor GSE-CHR-MK-17-07R]|jgi:DnaD/phage-associated family protein|nr:DnaD domain protein [Pleurocapsa minor GSE-CHR-MK 17-07R]
MTRFDGFEPGVPRIFTLPAAFVTRALPFVHTLAEMQVVLFAFYAVQQREGAFRCVRRADFSGHETLAAALATAVPHQRTEDALDAALSAAVEHGILLAVTVRDPAFETGEETLYFINAEPGRKAVAQILRGEWTPSRDGRIVDILPERPNVFALYEQNIGPLTPMIADSLKDAENEFSSAWLADAIKTAVENNVRNWRYIKGVLDRWKRDGRREGIMHEAAKEPDEPTGSRFTGGEFADFIES